ncbi:MAG: trigger factor [Terrimicrobiaceae bacterium]|nr:trigger factor [Terrimicrobiaceae bacterium]
MTISVEALPGCQARLNIELPPDRVSAERKRVAGEFQRQARLPGYRPGKAPLRMVETRYAKEIQEETINNLLRESLREAIREKSLDVLEVRRIQRAELDSVGALHIEATAVLEPEFEIPDYSSIEIELARQPIEDKNVEEFLESLREPHSTFEPVEGRAAQSGDYAVATYSATLDGQPLAEAVPGSPTQLCGGSNSWILLSERALLPGFSEAVAGMLPGSEKSFSLTVPSDYPLQALAGKTLDFRLELHSLNSRRIPALDDELAAKIMPGMTAESLRAWARKQLEAAAESAFENGKRRLALERLLSNANFDLPSTEVERETRGVLLDIIRENQIRGVSDEELRKHEDELIGMAQQSARNRVRAKFLLLHIARREKFEATEAELTELVIEIARRNQIPVKKLVASLRKRGGIEELREQILRRKALDLLAANVSVKLPAAQPAQPAHSE